MGEKVCFFTGHRDIRSEDAQNIIGDLDAAIDSAIRDGVAVFRSGGAVGFDTLAALCVLKRKQSNQKIKLSLYLPCRDQTRFWGEYDKGVHEYLIANADEVIYTAEEYSQGCMLYRNRRMVDGASVGIAYCNSATGGTAYTVEHAKKLDIRVVNIAQKKS